MQTQSALPCPRACPRDNGEIWVVNTGRDIRPGDYLISSDTPGHAMLDDPTRFSVGNLVAKAAESAQWATVPVAANGTRRCRLSVLFESFAPRPQSGRYKGRGRCFPQRIA